MQEQGSLMASLLPMVLIFGMFYFLFIKPQQKKAKEQKDMLDNLKVGDEVILQSGLIGTIDEIPTGKDYVFISFGKNNVIKTFKEAITDKYIEQTNVSKK